MGLFDKLKKKSNRLTIEEIIAKDYTQKYFDECKYIWKNYVPQKGQAANLQGELLREIEKIRCEAQDNGNINWDDDYSYFCDFISERLSEQPIFSSAEKEEIILIMSYIKECGVYAQKFNRGIISKNDVDMGRIAYTDDNLYDIICDKIGQLQKENCKPIPYKENDNIQVRTIKDVLINASNFLWSDSLFLPDTLVWQLDTKVVICDPDDVESEDDEIPQIAKAMGMPLSMGIQEVQQIVDNARRQVENCNIEQLFEAFLYYYDNDAFIEFL